MTEQEEEYSDYLKEHNVLQRLLDAINNLLEADPLPEDPLIEILHSIGCPLIPQELMKALERKVWRAYEEVRHLRGILIDLGREEDIYDSDTDENEYVGVIGEMGTGLPYSTKDHYDEYESSTSSSARCPSPQLQEHTVMASIAIEEVEKHPLSSQEKLGPCCTAIQKQS